MNEIHVARGAVRSTNRDKILLLRRAPHNKTNPGKWECPGGKLENGHTLRSILLEELTEEVGFKKVIIPQEEKFVETDRTFVEEGVYAGTTFITHFIIVLCERNELVTL